MQAREHLLRTVRGNRIAMIFQEPMTSLNPLQTGWDKTPPGPPLPADVVAGTRSRYVEAFERLTGKSFDDYLANPEVFSKGD